MPSRKLALRHFSCSVALYVKAHPDYPAIVRNENFSGRTFNIMSLYLKMMRVPRRGDRYFVQKLYRSYIADVPEVVEVVL
jgi:hypothetical protein